MQFRIVHLCAEDFAELWRNAKVFFQSFALTHCCTFCKYIYRLYCYFPALAIVQYPVLSRSTYHFLACCGLPCACPFLLNSAKLLACRGLLYCVLSLPDCHILPTSFLSCPYLSCLCVIPWLSIYCLSYHALFFSRFACQLLSCICLSVSVIACSSLPVMLSFAMPSAALSFDIPFSALPIFSYWN